jgi:hypothetical protein
MCIFGGGDRPAPPQMPAETARSKAPDGGAVAKEARRSVTDKRRAAQNTILTQGNAGISDENLGTKTLLGM